MIRPCPIRAPARPSGSKYGAFVMLSMPPATTMPVDPARIASVPCITAFMPDPQTLETVVQGTDTGNPAPSAACRAGACPNPAGRTLPIRTSPTFSAANPAFASAAEIATDPSSVAATPLKAP